MIREPSVELTPTAADSTDALATLGRVLQRIDTMQCADLVSPQFGCADREFWAYRTTRGFPSAPFQHVMSGLAYLSTSHSVEEQERLIQRALAALDYWTRSRNSNGSTNEWYRNEQSFCATAMGLQSATETLFVLRDVLPPTEMRHRIEELRNSATWLESRDNNLAANQRVASFSGRFLLGVLSGDEKMQSRAIDYVSKLESEFTSVGFLPEYGGMDVGYTLLSLDLLAVAHRAGFVGCEQFVAGVCTQLCCMVGGSGELPFELGSRGSHHHFFGGVLYFSKVVDSAHNFVKENAGLFAMPQYEDVSRYDDRYLATFGFSALVRRVALPGALQQSARPLAVNSLNFPPPDIVGRPFAGGTLFTNERFGGALSWRTSDRPPVTQLGYVFLDESGKNWTSLAYRAEADKTYRFIRVSDAMPLIRHEWLFRTLFSLCRLPGVAGWVSRIARTRAGRPRRSGAVILEREVTTGVDEVRVEDRLSLGKRVQGEIRPLEEFPFHAPSFMKHQQDTVIASQFSEIVKRALGERDPQGNMRITIRWKLVVNADREVSIQLA